MEDRLEHSPIPEYGDRYSFDHNRHFIRYVYHVYRDRLFADLVAKADPGQLTEEMEKEPCPRAWLFFSFIRYIFPPYSTSCRAS